MLNDIKDLLGLIISLSAVLGIFTGIVNKLFKSKLKPIEDRMDDNERKDIEHRMEQWRFEVTNFAGNLRRGIVYTRYEFEAVAKFADQYEMAVNKLGITNHLFTSEIQYINECYRELNNIKKIN